MDCKPVARLLRYAGCAGTSLKQTGFFHPENLSASCDMKILGQKLNRRFFLSLFSLSALTTFLPAKVFGISDYRNDKNIPKQYIQNRDRPGFFIRSANPFMGIDVNEWSLSVRGMVKSPIKFKYEDLFGFYRAFYHSANRQNPFIYIYSHKWIGTADKKPRTVSILNILFGDIFIVPIIRNPKHLCREECSQRRQRK
jgi:hypothetical protein